MLDCMSPLDVSQSLNLFHQMDKVLSLLIFLCGITNQLAFFVGRKLLYYFQNVRKFAIYLRNGMAL